VDEDLDARLVLVVAAAMAVVDAQRGFEEADHLVRGHEFGDARRDHRRAAHAAAGKELAADLARFVLHDLDADVVQAHGRAVGVAGDDRHLELARQVIEFRVERGPLAQQFGIGARIDDFIGGGAGEVVGRGVADAVAAGLDRVQLDLGEIGEDIGASASLIQLYWMFWRVVKWP
jgi:hypothetical protein